MRPVEIEPVVNLFVIAHGLFPAFNLIPDSIKRFALIILPFRGIAVSRRRLAAPIAGERTALQPLDPCFFLTETV